MLASTNHDPSLRYQLLSRSSTARILCRSLSHKSHSLLASLLSLSPVLDSDLFDSLIWQSPSLLPSLTGLGRTFFLSLRGVHLPLHLLQPSAFFHTLASRPSPNRTCRLAPGNWSCDVSRRPAEFRERVRILGKNSRRYIPHIPESGTITEYLTRVLWDKTYSFRSTWNRYPLLHRSRRTGVLPTLLPFSERSKQRVENEDGVSTKLEDLE